MQNKIQEIMGLVNQYGHHVVTLDNAKDNGSIIKALAVADSAYNAIQSKLRELVREPLSEKERAQLVSNWFAEDWSQKKAMGMLDDYESYNNITNTSGEA